MSTATNGGADGHPEREGTPKAVVPWEIPLECYPNGARRVIEVRHAIRPFWGAHCSYLLPLQWYRFDIGPHSRRLYLSEVVKERQMYLLLLLHRRCHLPLTREDLEDLDPKTSYLTLPNFHSRMSRIYNTLFADLPEHLIPIEPTQASGPDLKLRPAYRIKPRVDTFLITGVEPSSGFRPDDVDWTIFLTPPEPETSGGAQQ